MSSTGYYILANVFAIVVFGVLLVMNALRSEYHTKKLMLTHLIAFSISVFAQDIFWTIVNSRASSPWLILFSNYLMFFYGLRYVYNMDIVCAGNKTNHGPKVFPVRENSYFELCCFWYSYDSDNIFPFFFLDSKRRNEPTVLDNYSFVLRGFLDSYIGIFCFGCNR